MAVVETGITTVPFWSSRKYTGNVRIFLYKLVLVD